MRYRTVMSRILLLVISATAVTAQIQTIEMTFEGVGCVPCVESMPSRAKRIRGVEEAKVDGAGTTLSVRMAARTRVRIEQIRDLIEQDGTKTRSATVEILGAVSNEQGKTLLTVPEQPLPFELAGPKGESLQGNVKVKGSIRNLRPAPGERLRIEIREISPAN
jgi:hypothetical protein